MASDNDSNLVSKDLGLLIFGILSYSFVSIAVVYYNWWVFTKGFKFPVFVSWIQQLVGCCVFYLGSWLAGYFRTLLPIFPPAVLDRNVLFKAVPLTTSFVLMVGLANICLQKTLISTYQVARSLTLLFVVALSYWLLREKQSKIVLSACGLMVIGFMIGSMDPATLSLGGLLAGALSSVCQSLYNVLIKRTLAYVQDDNQMLLLYNLVLSSILFIPMVLIVEGFEPFSQAFAPKDGEVGALFITWISLVFSGILGTTLNMTAYLMVRVTSPLTFNIVGFAKSLVQSVGGIVFFGDSVSPASAAGIGLCLTGSLVYAKAKHDESKAATAAKAYAEVQGPDSRESTSMEGDQLSGFRSSRGELNDDPQSV